MPLVLATDGDRLAKRHGAVTLDDRLAVGDTPGRVVAVLARSLGFESPTRRRHQPICWTVSQPIESRSLVDLTPKRQALLVTSPFAPPC